MTAEALIKILQGYPPEMEVCIKELWSSFAYAPIEKVEKKVIPFSEEPGGKALSKEEVIILSDEI